MKICGCRERVACIAVVPALAAPITKKLGMVMDGFLKMILGKVAGQRCVKFASMASTV
jgi:hypothetical protein